MAAGSPQLPDARDVRLHMWAEGSQRGSAIVSILAIVERDTPPQVVVRDTALHLGAELPELLW